MHQNYHKFEFLLALVMIYAVLSNFDFVAKFTIKNLNKDFTNAVRGGGGSPFYEIFSYISVFFLTMASLKFSLRRRSLILQHPGDIRATII